MSTQPTVLYLSRQELEDRNLSLSALTDEGVLRLLTASGVPVTGGLEVETYPSPAGVLVFIHPRVPESPSACHLFVTFA